MSKYGLVRRRKVSELVKQFVPSGHRVLEVSCGRGEILKSLQDEGYAVREPITQNIPIALILFL